MRRTKKKWTLQEKLQALQSVKMIGLSRTSRELGMSVAALQRWRILFEQSGEQGLIGSKPVKDEQRTTIHRLQRELSQYKTLLAEKELTIRLQQELLKKSPSQKKTD
jgi:transposase-like protein